MPQYISLEEFIKNPIGHVLSYVNSFHWPNQKLNKLQYILIVLEEGSRLGLNIWKVLYEKVICEGAETKESESKEIGNISETSIEKFIEAIYEESYKIITSTIKDNKFIEDGARYVATLLFQSGKISHFLSIKFNVVAEDINKVFKFLLSCKNPEADPQNLSNSILGLGYLTKERCLQGRLGVGSINKMLDRLTIHPKTISQNYANALLGLGYLAQENCLEGKLDVSSINKMLGKLAKDKKTTLQGMANALLSLGHLANNDYLDGKLDVEPINAMLYKLSNDHQATTQNFANAILGVGYLANHDLLNGRVDAVLINSMLDTLAKSDETSHVSIISLMNVATLAKQSYLNGKLEAGSINAVLDRLARSNETPKEIADALLNVTVLAKEGCLNGKLNAALINVLLGMLLTQECEVTSHDISTAISAVWTLVEQGCLKEKLAFNQIELLLKKLSDDVMAPSQDIANVLFMAGCLKRREFLNINLETKGVIDSLLAKFENKHMKDTPPVKQIFQIAESFIMFGYLMPSSIRQLLQVNPPPLEARDEQNLLVCLIPYSHVEKLIEAWYVDLYVEGEYGKYIIDLDGPSHYLETGELQIKDQIRDQILREKGYQIFRIPRYWDMPNVILMSTINKFIEQTEKKLKKEAESNELFTAGASSEVKDATLVVGLLPKAEERFSTKFASGSSTINSSLLAHGKNSFFTQTKNRFDDLNNNQSDSDEERVLNALSASSSIPNLSETKESPESIVSAEISNQANASSNQIEKKPKTQAVSPQNVQPSGKKKNKKKNNQTPQVKPQASKASEADLFSDIKEEPTQRQTALKAGPPEVFFITTLEFKKKFRQINPEETLLNPSYLSDELRKLSDQLAPDFVEITQWLCNVSQWIRKDRFLSINESCRLQFEDCIERLFNNFCEMYATKEYTLNSLDSSGIFMLVQGLNFFTKPEMQQKVQVLFKKSTSNPSKSEEKTAAGKETQGGGLSQVEKEPQGGRSIGFPDQNKPLLNTLETKNEASPASQLMAVFFALDLSAQSKMAECRQEVKNSWDPLKLSLLLLDLSQNPYPNPADVAKWLYIISNQIMAYSPILLMSPKGKPQFKECFGSLFEKLSQMQQKGEVQISRERIRTIVSLLRFLQLDMKPGMEENIEALENGPIVGNKNNFFPSQPNAVAYSADSQQQTSASSSNRSTPEENKDEGNKGPCSGCNLL